MHERCTWDIECVFPRRSEHAGLITAIFEDGLVEQDDGDEDATMDDDEEENEEDDDPEVDAMKGRGFPELLFLCSGDLADHVVDPLDDSRKIMSYHLDSPVSACSILIALGPFEIFEIPNSDAASNKAEEQKAESSDDEEENDDTHQKQKNGQDDNDTKSKGQMRSLAFYLPGLKDDVQRTVSFMAKVQVSPILVAMLIQFLKIAGCGLSGAIYRRIISFWLL
jgi:hypothetical protein